MKAAPPATLMSRLRRVLAKPHVLLALLLLIASAVFAVRGGRLRAQQPEPVETGVASLAAGVPTEVRLLLVDEDGLQRPRFETVRLPPDDTGRVTAIVAALRSVLIAADVWPDGLPAPSVFAQRIDGKAVAVIDLRPSPGVAVSVGQELQLLRSIQGTVLGNGVDEVRFLRDGQPATTLLGHVAVRSALCPHGVCRCSIR